jgi:hypothetical protein
MGKGRIGRESIHSRFMFLKEHEAATKIADVGPSTEIREDSLEALAVESRYS